MGDALYMDWWPHWVSDLALQKSAVVISPNYRIMPGATSAEIYGDIEDFWTWLHSPALADLLAAHSAPTELDLSRILVAGESAGGLLGIYLALAHPTEIRAATVAYPWTDPGSEYFNAPRAGPVVGQHVPESVVEQTLQSIPHGTTETSVTSQERFAFMLAGCEYGKLAGMYARGSENVPRETLYPMAKLEQPGLQIPRGGIAVIQGRQDSVVPLPDVEKWVKRAREVFPPELIAFVVREGEHAFDVDARYEEQWLQDTFQKPVQAWVQ